MKTNKIRLHKLVQKIINEDGLEFTQAEIANNIQEYGVKVNEKLINKRLHWTWPNSVIDISHWPTKGISDYSGLRIIDKTSDFWVIYKPAGITSAPGSGHQNDNLIKYLRESYGLDFWLVHRLDKDTEGLMLIAITENNQKFFQDQFRLRTVQKMYISIIKGRLVYKVQAKHWQYRNSKNPLKQKLFWSQDEAIKYHPKARIAETVIYPLAYSNKENTTLVEVQIKTGRMHQIRLLSQGLGHPILGDKVYNSNLSVNLSKHRDKGYLNLEYAFDLDNLDNNGGTGGNPTNKLEEPRIIFSNYIEAESDTKARILSAGNFTSLFEPKSFYLKSKYLKFKNKKGKVLEYKL